MKLSKNFTMDEMCRTSTGYINVPNVPERIALKQLVDNLLQPLRDLYGKPIRVTSGYRSPLVNKSIGGAQSSQHVKGQAADITGGSAEENEILFNLIRENFTFDQLIDEFGYSWIHVSYTSGVNRREVLRATKQGKKTKYTKL
jgi:zinc D-Ala-D-Ala carboxypeptidase